MERTRPLEVYITVDTEIWCDGWNDIDARFPRAYERYILGRTTTGDWGLPFLLKVLGDHGLKAVFFVEPYFSYRFGLAPLQEIVGMLAEAGQSIELHPHTEWLDELPEPLLPPYEGKRQHLKNFSADEQRTILEAGVARFAAAGATNIRACRAGNFGANDDTLRALAAAGIGIDSSVNSAHAASAINCDNNQAVMIDGVLEVPMATFNDGFGRARPATVTACSFGEFRTVMHDALHKNWRSFVILTHSFEMLNRGQTRRNTVVAKRFEQLCAFLDRHRDDLPTADFSSLELAPYDGTAAPLSSGFVPSAIRVGQQIASNLS